MEQDNRAVPIVITKDDLQRTRPPVAAAPATQPPGMRPESQASTVRPESQVEPAGFWIRLLAKGLDLVLAFAAYLVTVTLLVSLWWFGCLGQPLPAWEAFRPVLPRIGWYLLLGYVLFYAAYSIFVHAADGRSLGKSICGVRVLVPATVSGATFSMLLYFSARFLVAAMGLTLLAIGHLIAGFRQDKRALHDMVVGSRVMKQATPKPQE